jgi:hypothetical protein
MELLAQFKAIPPLSQLACVGCVFLAVVAVPVILAFTRRRPSDSAARRLAAAGKRFALVEAADQPGGRCITDMSTFGVPYDRGAHWIYAADINPLARLAPQTGLVIYPAPPGQRMRIGGVGRKLATSGGFAVGRWCSARPSTTAPNQHQLVRMVAGCP